MGQSCHSALLKQVPCRTSVETSSAFLSKPNCSSLIRPRFLDTLPTRVTDGEVEVLDRRITDLDISLLVALDALLKDENVTHAAARLNISQSALSGRLTKLRHILNDPLFIPASTGRGMTPTPHALSIKLELRQILDRLRQFAMSAPVFDPATSTRAFRIAATDNPAAILGPDFLALIHGRAPQIRISLTLPEAEQVGRQLEQGDLDLFIGAVGAAPADLIGRTLFEDEFVTAQRVGHPRGTSDLTLDTFCAADHLLISADGGNFFGVIDGALAEIGRSRRVTTSVQSYALAPLMLSATDCLCTLPRRFLDRFSKSLDIFAPPVQLEPIAFNLYWHPKASADPGNQWLRALIIEAADRK